MQQVYRPHPARSRRRWLLLSGLLALVSGCDDSTRPAAQPPPDLAAAERLIDAALLAGRFEAARSAAEEAARAIPADERAHELLARTLACEAAQCPVGEARSQLLAESLRSYESALVIRPTWAGVAHAAGVVANQLGRQEDALRHYRSACAADSSSAQYRLYEGLALFHLKRYEEARQAMRLAAELDPRSGWPLAALAELSLATGDTAAALDFAQRARRASPDTLAFRVTEAKVLRHLGRHEAVLLLLGALPEVDRAEEAVAWELAAAHAAQGNHRSSAAAWELRAHSCPADPAPALAAARAWLAGEDFVRAQRWLELAREAGADEAALTDAAAELNAAIARRQSQ